MDLRIRNNFKHSPIRLLTLVAVAGALAVGAAPVASATDGESGAVSGAGFGPTLGVGGPSSYSGGGTANHPGDGSATLGVGGPSSYSGGASANHPGGTATRGVGGVNSFTGDATAGNAQNGTNTTTRTGNFGPGH